MSKTPIELQLEALKNHYIHSMSIYHAHALSKTKNANMDKVYGNGEISDFYKKVADNMKNEDRERVYELGWLDGYKDAINTIQSFVDKKM